MGYGVGFGVLNGMRIPLEKCDDDDDYHYIREPYDYDWNEMGWDRIQHTFICLVMLRRFMATSLEVAEQRYIKTLTYVNQFYYVYLHGENLLLGDYVRYRVAQTDSNSASKFLSICIKGGGSRTPLEGTQGLIARDDMKSR